MSDDGSLPLTEKLRTMERVVHPSAQAHEQFRVMADVSPVMIWVTHTDASIAFVNRAYCEFFGVTAEGVKAGGWQPLVHPEDVEQYVNTFLASLASRSTFRCRCRVRHADGSWRWIESYAAPWFAPDGTYLGSVGSSPDITELIEAQAAADRARAEAEAANRMRDEAIAMISHELRTPMTAITGWTAMLAAGDVDAETHALALASLRSSGQVLQKMVDDLLDFGRITGGKFSVETVPINVADVVRESVGVVSALAAEKGVRLSVQLPALPVIVSGDGQRLQQVVTNLLTNAVKFTRSGGTVEVRLEEADSEAILTVKDTGRGMSEEFLQRIFSRFAQQEVGSGLGLGLSITKEIVELHGGSIAAASEGQGKGSTFTVRLPAPTLTP